MGCTLSAAALRGVGDEDQDSDHKECKLSQQEARMCVRACVCVCVCVCVCTGMAVTSAGVAAVPGIIASISEEGYLCLSYMGTDPPRW